MAKNLFSLDIINSDSFINLPCSARLLYYDLSVRADKDGLLRCPKAIARMTGASSCDLELLINRGFVCVEGGSLFVGG